MPGTALIELNIFPSVCYFRMLRSYDKVVFEVQESFQKQTYRNRFEVLSDKGVERLSVPLEKYPNNTRTCDIRIDYSTPWMDKILRALKTNYASSPYYEYYIDDIARLLHMGIPELMTLNMEILRLFFRWLDMELVIQTTDEFLKNPTGMTDLRDITLGKRKKMNDWQCDNKAYRQVFGNEFAPHLSVLDLIFCMGPMSPRFIKF